MSLSWPPGHVDTVMNWKTTSMATIVKQWNELPGRAGESLFVCYSWPGLLLALTPPNSVGEPTRGLAFFRQWDSANLAQEIPICSCSPPEIQPDPCKIAAGWRVVCRKREGVVCVWVGACVHVFQWKKWNGQQWNLCFLDGTCRVSLRSKQQQGCELVN